MALMSRNHVHIAVLAKRIHSLLPGQVVSVKLLDRLRRPSDLLGDIPFASGGAGC